jgi:hypothetical protein
VSLIVDQRATQAITRRLIRRAGGRAEPAQAEAEAQPAGSAMALARRAPFKKNRVRKVLTACTRWSCPTPVDASIGCQVVAAVSMTATVAGLRSA